MRNISRTAWAKQWITHDMTRMLTLGDQSYMQSCWVGDGASKGPKPEGAGKTDVVWLGEHPDKVPFYKGVDDQDRQWVSTVAGVLGGTTEDDVMEEMIQLMNADGMMVAIDVKLDWWVHEESGKNYAAWGHPLFVQFRNPQAYDEAAARIKVTRTRRDDGGNRILKLERSENEFRLDPELRNGDVGSGINVGARMSLTQGTDWFTREMWARSQNPDCGDFEVMKSAARAWEVNRGAPIRRFKGGTRGSDQWS